ncbi:MAG: TIM barrel protein [Bryobacteraceae bacterium]
MRVISRRNYFRTSAAAIASLISLRGLASGAQQKLFFKIAQGEYSFNTAYRAGKYNALELAALTRNRFGLGAIDYVSSFWADKAHDRSFLAELKKRAADNDVVNHIILVNLSGPQLGDPDERRREAAVEAHRFWLAVAQFLGCSGIRVNLNGFGRPGQKQAALNFAVDGYRKLLEYGARDNLDVLVQNHIGFSCDPSWIVEVMKKVDNKHGGIEADPGHFQEIFSDQKPGGGYNVVNGESFNLYAGWAKLVPFAKAGNAKTHSFDAQGNEITMDYRGLIEIVKNAGSTGYIGIEGEPEGARQQLSPADGIEKTKALLEKDDAAP